jgi:hypothetical protein
MDAPRFARLNATARRFIFALPDAVLDGPFIRQCLEFPERLAASLGIAILIAIDEFQELAALETKREKLEPYRMMRSVWQRQQRTAYVGFCCPGKAPGDDMAPSPQSGCWTTSAESCRSSPAYCRRSPEAATLLPEDPHGVPRDLRVGRDDG